MATRVWKLTESLKDSFRVWRDKQGIISQDAVDLAVTTHLHEVADQLMAIGMGEACQGDQPVKLLVSDTCVEALNETAERVGIPALFLARLCIARAAIAPKRIAWASTITRRCLRTGKPLRQRCLSCSIWILTWQMHCGLSNWEAIDEQTSPVSRWARCVFRNFLRVNSGHCWPIVVI